MRYKQAAVSVFARFAPQKARTMVIQAFKTAACHMGNTAKALGVSNSSLRSVIQLIELDAELKAISERYMARGKHHYQTADYASRTPKREETMRQNGTRAGRPAKQ